MTNTPNVGTKQQKKPITRWDVLIIFAGTALVSMTLVPWWGITHGYDSSSVMLFVIFFLWNGLSITAGYHRLWSHKSYQAHFIVRFIFALGGALSVQNSIKEWCSGHRNHHRYTDDPDLDPYAATRGFWYSHMGWMTKDYRSGETDYSNIKDLERDALVNWQHKYYAVLALSMNFGLPLGIGFLYGDAIGALLLAGFLRLFLCHHSTFLINSLAHYWGRQPYSDENTSRDNGIIALFTYGEGYHNFHHKFQWDYRNGIKWYQFDPTKWLIKSLSWSGLAESLKRVEAARIEISLANMRLKKARAGLDSPTRLEKLTEFAHLNRNEVLELVEKEYEELVRAISDWSHVKQQWVQCKTDELIEKWDRHELKSRLIEIERRMKEHRKNWETLTAQLV